MAGAPRGYLIMTGALRGYLIMAGALRGYLIAGGRGTARRQVLSTYFGDANTDGSCQLFLSWASVYLD